VSDPAALSLVEVASAIRARKLSSVEVARALLARIERWQPAINAFVRVEVEEALAAAAGADVANVDGAAVGPLHGVPLAHKNMFYLAGMIAECGSKIRKGMGCPNHIDRDRAPAEGRRHSARRVAHGGVCLWPDRS